MSSQVNASDPDPASGDGGRPTQFALTPREHRRLADVLLKAARDQRPILPLSERYPELTVADALKIRDLSIGNRVTGGERLIGAKISLGDPDRRAADRQPHLGWLTEGMLLATPVVELTNLIHPRVQAKVALRLARPLRRPLATVTELVALTDRVLPCLEIIDGRYEPISSESVDEIADNCAVARLAVGEGIPTPSEAELRRFCVQVHIQSGPSATATQSPRPCAVETALWLANRVIDEGAELEAGGLLVSAACDSAVELRPGSRVRADFDSLGLVSIQTTSTGSEVQP
jgi:2-keto-4-pentenoate hydratase